MAFSLLYSSAAIFVAYLLWKLFYPYFTTLSIDQIPGPAPQSLLLGNIPTFADRQGWKALAQYAETYGSVFLIKSFFGRRMLLIHDPKAMHHIMLKDQEFFPKRLEPSNDINVLLGPGLLSTVGSQHKRQRKLLNPVFSAAHLRDMTHMFYRIAHKLNEAMSKRVPTNGSAEELDVNGWMARTTLEMLGQAGLGYSFDNFLEDSTDNYGESLKLFFPTLAESTILLNFAIEWLSGFLSESFIVSFLRVFPVERVRRLVGISDTMSRRSVEIITERKALLERGDEALKHEVGEGKDIMSILLKANMAVTDNEKMTDKEIFAQTGTFILAGMDTTSNALSRTLHLLAIHPDVQEKLRAEIVEAQGGDRSDIPYDDLVKLPYLDAICRETLRLYAPVILSAPRTAARDVALPLDQPVRGRDGKQISEIVVPRGTTVQVHYQASNVNKVLWGEDANQWKPERWLSPLPASVEDARIPGVYAHLMTFNAGTHSCIGFKFSQLEMKIVLAILLSTYSFELSDKPVAWNLSPVVYPTMGEDSPKPELRLKVKLLK